MFDHDSNAEGGGLITADFFTQGSMAVAVVSHSSIFRSKNRHAAQREHLSCTNLVAHLRASRSTVHITDPVSHLQDHRQCAANSPFTKLLLVQCYIHSSPGRVRVELLQCWLPTSSSDLATGSTAFDLPATTTVQIQSPVASCQHPPPLACIQHNLCNNCRGRLLLRRLLRRRHGQPGLVGQCPGSR